MLLFVILGVLGLIGLGIVIRDRHVPDWLFKLSVLYYVLAPIIIAVYLIYSLEIPGWRELLIFGIFCILTAFGTGIGYHRLATHDAFKAKSWVSFMFIVLGAMAFPRRPIDFAAEHLLHHAHSDDDEDPHSPIHGFWHAHIGNIFDRSTVNREKWCRRLLNDPLVMFIDRTYLVWFLLGLALPAFMGYLMGIGALQGLIWGGAIRILYHNHVTFSVNSICHTFGSQEFDTKDESRNNWLVALLAFGEGWHHNHHAFPKIAKHGIGWIQFDLNGLVILALAKLGLAWDVWWYNTDLKKVERRWQRTKSKLAPVPVSGDD